MNCRKFELKTFAGLGLGETEAEELEEGLPLAEALELVLVEILEDGLKDELELELGLIEAEGLVLEEILELGL